MNAIDRLVRMAEALGEAERCDLIYQLVGRRSLMMNMQIEWNKNGTVQLHSAYREQPAVLYNVEIPARGR